MRVALRVEARTVRGLREGVPKLMRLFSQYQVRASFFFPLGQDLSGRYPLSTWRERRALGLQALTYGTLRAAPSMADEALKLMKIGQDNGHETGVLGLSPQQWQRQLAHADADWVRAQCRQLDELLLASALPRPSVFATPGWQTHPALLAGLSPSNYRFTSMTRGRMPYLPQLQGVRSPLPELPTTLPSVSEMLARPGVDAGNVHEYLYAESQHVLPAGHVFSVNAEHEGIERLSVMEKLVVMWKGQEGSVRALGDMLKEIDSATLPHHQVGWDAVDGAAGYVATQSVQVPA